MNACCFTFFADVALSDERPVPEPGAQWQCTVCQARYEFRRAPEHDDDDQEAYRWVKVKE